jgi:hypothetical protein
MVTPPADNSTDRSESDPIRDASKLIVEHPIPLYDPHWLRRLHTGCLWDGGTLTGDSAFCSTRCEERYTEWEHHTVHILLGREPLQTFYEQGRDVGGIPP